MNSIEMFESVEVCMVICKFHIGGLNIPQVLEISSNAQGESSSCSHTHAPGCLFQLASSELQQKLKLCTQGWSL